MMKTSGWLALLGGTVVAVTLAACGSSSGPTGPTGSTQVTISNFAFSSLTVPVGTTVTWKNADSTAHTATADGTSAFQWDTGSIQAGATSQGVVFRQAGTFTYHCTIHPTMHGTIVVQ